MVAELISHVADPSHRDRLRDAAGEAWSRIGPLADDLPQQAIHLDLTDANVVVSRAADGTARPDGVIDFGDLTHSWAVSELAITASSVLGHPGTDPTSVLPAIRAFHDIRPLTATEIDVLWPMLVLRTAVLIVSGAQQAALDPDNAYITEQSDGEWRMFEQATSVPMDVMTELIRADLGLSAEPGAVAVTAPLVAGLDPESVATLDLSPTSDVYDFAFRDGGWLAPDIEDKLASAAIQNGAAMVVTRFGQPRLSRAPSLSQESPDVVPTGISLWPATAVRVAAPWDGDVVDRSEDGVTVRGRDYELNLAGVGPAQALGSRLTAGQALADAPSGRWVELGVRPVGAPHAPPLTRAELAAGWLALTRDPRPLLGLPTLDGDRPGRDLLSRRDARFAQVQEHYYAKPPQIERGWRHFLMSTAGRCYLDMVNNVTVLGHAHPRVAGTAARQLRRLNTNSRFNYEAVVEFSERLAATLPDPLDTVLLVNSGSEASDLALRLAMAATGRRDVVAVREAYHGWTYGTDAVSTSIADNPNAPATRPDWVHTVESPNTFRGKYRGAELRSVCRRGGAADRGTRRRRPGTRRVHLGNGLRQRRRDGAAGSLFAEGVRGGARRRGPRHRRRGSGRLRPSRRMVLGFSAAERAARYRVHREIDRQRLSPGGRNHHPRGRRRIPHAGLFLFVHRRQPAVVRDRHHRPRRSPR